MQIMGKNIYLWPFKFCIFCIFALHVSWARPFVASQSDHYRRLFSGTLGMLTVVLPNQHLPVTIVHFVWYSPCLIVLVGMLKWREVALGLLPVTCIHASTSFILSSSYFPLGGMVYVTSIWNSMSLRIWMKNHHFWNY